MNTPLALLVITAVAGLLVLALVGFDSEITGQPAIRLPKKALEKVVEKPKSQPNVEIKKICDCPNPYEGKILTLQQNSVFAGISWFDCVLIEEIIKLRKKSKMDPKETVQWENLLSLCKKYNW